jgi:DNA mismatch repair protein MSH4
MWTSAKVLGTRPGVLNLHLATELTNADSGTPKMTMLYKISSGLVDEPHYGLNMARSIGFPAEFIQAAEHVSSVLEEQMQKKEKISAARKLMKRRNLILKLYDALVQLQDSDMDDENLGSYLKSLQVEFVSKMDRIETGQTNSEGGGVIEEVE